MYGIMYDLGYCTNTLVNTGLEVNLYPLYMFYCVLYRMILYIYISQHGFRSICISCVHIVLHVCILYTMLYIHISQHESRSEFVPSLYINMYSILNSMLYICGSQHGSQSQIRTLYI